MNILGFVSSLLIILGISFASFQDSLISSMKVQKSYIAYADASRNAQNEYETQYYKSQRKKPKPKTQEKIGVKKEPYIPKKIEDMPDCARFNLLTENPKPFFTRLIKTLYGNTILKGEKIEPLVDQILTALEKNKGKLSHLAQLQLTDPKLQTLFYKMLKGTPSFGKQIGSPSLLDYVKIEGDEKICLACSNSVMLTALFGEKTAESIEGKRKEKMDQLQIPQPALQELLQKDPAALKENFASLIYHQHKGKTKPIASGTDDQHTITVKKKTR